MSRRQKDSKAAFSDLHAAALDAIRSGSVDEYEALIGTYIAAMTEFPREWSRYGATYDEDIARGLSPLGLGVIDDATRNIYLEGVEALGSSTPEIRESAIGLVYRLCVEAVKLGASGLLKKAMPLFPALYGKATGLEAESGQLATDQIVREAFELVSTHMPLAVGKPDPTTPVDPMFETAYRNLASIGRRIIELSTVDDATKFTSKWRSTIRWLSHATDSSPASAPNQQPDDGPTLSELSGGYEFGLLWWSLRPVWVDQVTSFSPDICRAFRSQIDTGRDLFDGATVALANKDDLFPWDEWLLLTLVEDEPHWMPTRSELLKVYVIAAALLDQGQRSTAVGPREWLSNDRRRLHEIIDELKDAEDIWTSIEPVDRYAATEGWRERLDNLADLIDSATAEYAVIEDRLVAEMPLDPSRVDEIRASLVNSWEDARIAPALFKIAGAYSSHYAAWLDQGPPEGARVLGQGARLPRRMFTEQFGETVVAPYDGRDIGWAMANGELYAVLDSAGEISAGEIPTGDGTPRDQAETYLRLCFESMRRAGYQPTAALVPLRFSTRWWRRWDQGESRPEPLSEWQLPGTAADRYLGTVDGVPIFYWNLPEGRLYLVDLVAFGSWNQYVDDHPDGLEVGVEAISRERALELADQSLAEGTPAFEREIDRIMAQVTLWAREAVEIKMVDPSAVRWVRLAE